MCKCLILTAIASGYAGRDPQGGFCDRSVYSFIEIVKKKSEGSSLFLSYKNEKENYVKVKKKVKDEEGGQIRKRRKRLCTNDLEKRMKTIGKKWRKKSCWRSIL